MTSRVLVLAAMVVSIFVAADYVLNDGRHVESFLLETRYKANAAGHGIVSFIEEKIG